jgi:hypothetical protein
MSDLWKEKDPLVYMVKRGEGNAPGTTTENSSHMSLAEKRKQERQAVAKEREERRMAEKKRQEEQNRREEEEKELAQRKLEAEAAEKANEEARSAKLRENAPTSSLSDLERKIAQLEGVGTEDEEKEFRIFILRPGQKGRTITVKKDAQLTWLPFCGRIRELCALKDVYEPLRLYSAYSGRLDNVRAIVSDDILFVASDSERKEENIKNEIRKLKEARENAERERKQREQAAKEAAQLQMKAILRQREQMLNTLSAEKRNQWQRLREVEEKTYECEICMSDVTLRDLFTIDRCFHRFCRDCVRGHIEAQIETQSFVDSGAEVGIICPGNACENILGMHEVKACVDAGTFDRYDILLRDNAVMKVRDLRWCTTPDCKNVLVISKDSPMLVCYACCGSWCADCDVPWHGDMTCKEYKSFRALQDRERHHTKQTLDLIMKTTKPCPNCDSPIEKNGGCNHMTCGLCYHEFCWLCLADYDRGRHFSWSRCEQFS